MDDPSNVYATPAPDDASSSTSVYPYSPTKLSYHWPTQKIGFQHLVMNDRNAIWTAIGKRLPNVNVTGMSNEERFKVLQEIRDKKLLEREQNGKTTAREKFPDDWKLGVEDNWLWQKCFKWIQEGEYKEHDGDEEEESHIKKEKAGDTSRFEDGVKSDGQSGISGRDGSTETRDALVLPRYYKYAGMLGRTNSRRQSELDLGNGEILDRRYIVVQRFEHPVTLSCKASDQHHPAKQEVHSRVESVEQPKSSPAPKDAKDSEPRAFKPIGGSVSTSKPAGSAKDGATATQRKRENDGNGEHQPPVKKERI